MRALATVLLAVAIMPFSLANSPQPIPLPTADFSLGAPPLVGAWVNLSVNFTGVGGGGEVELRTPDWVEIHGNSSWTPLPTKELQHASWWVRPTRDGAWTADLFSSGHGDGACCLYAFSNETSGTWTSDSRMNDHAAVPRAIFNETFTFERSDNNTLVVRERYQPLAPWLPNSTVSVVAWGCGPSLMPPSGSEATGDGKGPLVATAVLVEKMGTWQTRTQVTYTGQFDGPATWKLAVSGGPCLVHTIQDENGTLVDHVIPFEGMTVNRDLRDRPIPASTVPGLLIVLLFAYLRRR